MNPIRTAMTNSDSHGGRIDATAHGAGTPRPDVGMAATLVTAADRPTVAGP
ncbi:hypothetical protein [Embleya scabrispora]|uniref:hypothetical protein n=1 Tax=Embleya scabrispora TaxID=159449 RepID=UPI0013749834|nr:hypothetical protein [Embleya scabrispora]